MCDSDDFFTENKIEKVIDIFDENIESKIVFDLPIYKFDNKIVLTKNKKNFIKVFGQIYFLQVVLQLKKMN